MSAKAKNLVGKVKRYLNKKGKRFFADKPGRLCVFIPDMAEKLDASPKDIKAILLKVLEWQPNTNPDKVCIDETRWPAKW